MSDTLVRIIWSVQCFFIFLLVYTFRDGKIVRVRNFYDTAAYERALTPRSLA
jgi:predicted ester cyclase